MQHGHFGWCPSTPETSAVNFLADSQHQVGEHRGGGGDRGEYREHREQGQNPPPHAPGGIRAEGRALVSPLVGYARHHEAEPNGGGPLSAGAESSPQDQARTSAHDDGCRL